MIPKTTKSTMSNFVCQCNQEPFASFLPFGRFEAPQCQNRVYRKLDAKYMPLCKNHFVVFLRSLLARGFVQIYR